MPSSIAKFIGPNEWTAGPQIGTYFSQGRHLRGAGGPSPPPPRKKKKEKKKEKEENKKKKKKKKKKREKERRELWITSNYYI